MRFCKTQHSFYCGIDLYARSMFTHILDQEGKTALNAICRPASTPSHAILCRLGLKPMCHTPRDETPQAKPSRRKL
jgi:hypothetical protein